MNPMDSDLVWSHGKSSFGSNCAHVDTHSGAYKFNNTVRNSNHTKESIILPIYKNGDKTDCNNYRGISILPTMYRTLSNILLSRSIPCAEEIIGDHQCGFQRNRSNYWSYLMSMWPCIVDIVKVKYQHIARRMWPDSGHILRAMFTPRSPVRHNPRGFPGTVEPQFTNAPVHEQTFRAKKSWMTNGVSDYEHAHWQQRQAESIGAGVSVAG
jgi:hypothetical protein